ncbi:MAG: LamG domain-containing protein, partial [Kiritimatiellae bacterium]|nr:LamG domain-containing protein [Kiritimatiellia bacterium]
MKKLSMSFAAMMLALAAGAETIAYWPFDDEDVSGAYITDKSGNGNNLQFAGVSVLNGSAVLSGAQTFFGAPEYANNRLAFQNYYETQDGRTSLTAEFWAKITAGDNEGEVILIETAFACPSDTYSFNMTYNEGNGTVNAIVVHDANYEASNASAAFTADGKWHHFALVIDPAADAVSYDGVTRLSCAELYIDFELAAQMPWNYQPYGEFLYRPIAFYNPPFYIGSRQNNQMKFVGELDDIRLSNEALAPADFITERSAPLLDSQIVAYWPFGETGMNDVSGHGYKILIDGEHAVSDTEDNCLALDGSQTQCEVGTALNFGANSDITVEYWAKFDSSLGDFMFLEFSENCNNYNYGFYVDFSEGGNGKVLVTWKTPYGYMQTISGSVNLVGDSDWHHYAVVFNPSAGSVECVRLYIDKVNVFAGGADHSSYTSSDIEWPGYKLYLGARDNSIMRMNGQIDDLRICSGCLTPSQFVAERTEEFSCGYSTSTPIISGVFVNPVGTETATVNVELSSLGYEAERCDLYYVDSSGATNVFASGVTETGTVSLEFTGLSQATSYSLTILATNEKTGEYASYPFSFTTKIAPAAIAYWPFDDGDDNVDYWGTHYITDRSGNGHTLQQEGVSYSNGAAFVSSAVAGFGSPANANYRLNLGGINRLTVECWANFTREDNPGDVRLIQYGSDPCYEPGSFCLYYNGDA